MERSARPIPTDHLLLDGAEIKEIKLLPKEQWPPGWSNPPQVEWIAECRLVDLFPWTLLHGEPLEAIHQSLKESYPTRTVVPVFKRGDNDDTACWEVSTGRIVIIHLGADEGSEVRGSFDDFWSFFRSVLDEFVERAIEETGSPQRGS